jgi:hypothetical protein
VRIDDIYYLAFFRKSKKKIKICSGSHQGYE